MNEESTRKISFGANVDQVHIGDSVSHGTPITNSNVVNVQFGEREERVEYVTQHQKRMIAQLVQRIVEVTEEEPLEVWRKVLARAGARKARLILKGAYIDVEEYLVEWLGRATQTPAKQAPAAAPPSAQAVAQPVAQPVAPAAAQSAAQSVTQHAASPAACAAAPVAYAAPTAFAASAAAAASAAFAPSRPPDAFSSVHPAACPHCDANRRDAASARFNMKVAVGVLGAAALAIAFFGYKASDAASALHALRTESTGCMFEGKSYAVGSIIDNPSAPDIECVRTPAGSLPEWQTLRPSRVARR